MKSYDFEYDGTSLSNLGYTVCNFDSGDLETVSNGSEITFNTVSTLGGAKYQLSSTSYDTCLEATFQICKQLCADTEAGISLSELRTLMRWLNRKGFHKFKLLDDDYSNYYFEGSFNISRIEIDNILVGLELTLITNRPFALQEPVTISLNNSVSGGTVSFSDTSDEEGYIYPETQIIINEDGDLSIYNELEERYTYIANCTAGEVITMSFPIISTSESSHKIQDDFNWNFLRVVNTYESTVNSLVVSLSCDITMEYSPIAKVGL